MPRSERAMFVALLVVATLLRFGDLDRTEIWLDEAISFRNASGTFADTVGALTSDNKPPLYYFVLGVWMKSFGDGVSAIRSLSALCGVLLVVALWWLGPVLVGRNSARVAALLAALHPLAIHYSREGRNYSMLILLAALTILTMAKAVDSGERRWWAAYAFALSACVLTMYLGVLLVPIVALQLLSTNKKGRLYQWLLASGLALLPLLAWWPIASTQREIVVASLAWYVPFWESWGPAGVFARSLLTLLPGGTAPPWVGLPSSTALQPVVILSGVSVLVSFLFPRAAAEGEGPGIKTRILILTAIVFPLASLLLASVVAFPVYLVGRADVIVLPAVLLLVASGIVRARKPVVAIVVGSLIASSTLVGVFSYFAHEPENHESTVLRPLAEALRTGDLVVCTNLTRPTAEYYTRHDSRGVVRVTSYPREVATHPAIFDPLAWSDESGHLEAEAAEVVTGIEATLRSGGRAVILMTDDESTRPLRQAVGGLPRQVFGVYRLNREGTPVRVVTFGGRGP